MEEDNIVVTQNYRNAEAVNQSNKSLPATCILLESHSTFNVLSNTHLLTKICSYDHTIRIWCNFIIVAITQVGELKGFGIICYHLYVIENIIFLSKAKENLWMIYNSGNINRFDLHKRYGATRYFNQTPKDMYYLDTTENTKRDHYVQHIDG